MDPDIKHLSIAFPLDTDGFLRRECPECLREFKWLPNDSSSEPSPLDSEAHTDEPPLEYRCPYCAKAASADKWFTRGQLRKVERVMSDEVLDPALRNLRQSLRDLGSSSGGLITADLSMSQPRLDALTEPDDMVRVDFSCHVNEPVKVVESWSGPVHCLICGRAAGP